MKFLYQLLSFGMIVSSALMIWKGLMVVTGSESPIVVVLSGSMEPAFHRGDLLFLTNYREEPVRVGEIVVFKVEGRDIPIVHRVLKLHENKNGSVKFLTKGDNNSVDDRGLYAPGQLWLTKKDVVGRARGFLPYVGMVTILMNEYPKFKLTNYCPTGFARSAFINFLCHAGISDFTEMNMNTCCACMSHIVRCSCMSWNLCSHSQRVMLQYNMICIHEGIV